MCKDNNNGIKKLLEKGGGGCQGFPKIALQNMLTARWPLHQPSATSLHVLDAPLSDMNFQIVREMYLGRPQGYQNLLDYADLGSKKFSVGWGGGGGGGGPSPKICGGMVGGLPEPKKLTKTKFLPQKNFWWGNGGWRPSLGGLSPPTYPHAAALVHPACPGLHFDIWKFRCAC